MKIISETVRTNNNNHDDDDDDETTLSLSVIFVMGQSLNDAKCENIERTPCMPHLHPKPPSLSKTKIEMRIPVHHVDPLDVYAIHPPCILSGVQIKYYTV